MNLPTNQHIRIFTESMTILSNEIHVFNSKNIRLLFDLEKFRNNIQTIHLVYGFYENLSGKTFCGKDCLIYKSSNVLDSKRDIICYNCLSSFRQLI